MPTRENSEIAYQRNLNILALYAQGYSYKEIGEQIEPRLGPDHIKHKLVDFKTGSSLLTTIFGKIDNRELSLQDVLRDPGSWQGLPSLTYDQQQLFSFVVENGEIPPIKSNPQIKSITEAISLLFFGESRSFVACVSAYYAAVRSEGIEIPPSEVEYILSKNVGGNPVAEAPKFPTSIFPETRESKQEALNSAMVNNAVFLDILPAAKMRDAFAKNAPRLLAVGKESIVELLYEISEGASKNGRNKAFELLVQACLNKVPGESDDDFLETTFIDVLYFAITDAVTRRGEKRIARLHFVRGISSTIHEQLIKYYAEQQGLSLPLLYDEVNPEEPESEELQQDPEEATA